MPKSILCRREHEKRGNYNFFASNAAIKCYLGEAEVEEEVEMGLFKAAEVVGSMLRLWQGNGNKCKPVSRGCEGLK